LHFHLLSGQYMLMHFMVRVSQLTHTNFIVHVSQLRRAGCGLPWRNPPKIYETYWVLVARPFMGALPQMCQNEDHMIARPLWGV